MTALAVTDPPPALSSFGRLAYILSPLLAAIAIAWGSLAPPEKLPSIQFAFADKVEHAGAYTLLAALLLRDWLRDAPPHFRSALRVILVCALFGFYIECLQGLSGFRDFEVADALTNVIGATAGTALWSAWQRRHVLAVAAGTPPHQV